MKFEIIDSMNYNTLLNMPSNDELLFNYIDGKQWRLNRSIRYSTDKGQEFIVSIGFITDFASIPRPLWSILPPTSPKCAKSAVLHDYLYKFGFSCQPLVTRKHADDLFKEGLLSLGASKSLTNIVYWSVRVFGGTAYVARKS